MIHCWSRIPLGKCYFENTWCISTLLLLCLWNNSWISHCTEGAFTLVPSSPSPAGWSVTWVKDTKHFRPFLNGNWKSQDKRRECYETEGVTSAITAENMKLWLAKSDHGVSTNRDLWPYNSALLFNLLLILTFCTVTVTLKIRQKCDQYLCAFRSTFSKAGIKTKFLYHDLCLNYILLSQHPQDSIEQIVNNLMKSFESGSNCCLLLQLSQFINLFLLKEVESQRHQKNPKTTQKSHFL